MSRSSEGCISRTVLTVMASLLVSMLLEAQEITLTTLASFAGTNGSGPWASLVEATDGNLYGTTYAGGASGHYFGNESAGTIFRVTSSGVLTCLRSFVGPNGSHPRGALIEGADGNLYGTTQEGGDCPGYGPFGSQYSSPGLGTIFRITKDGIFTALLSFWETNGSWPATALVKAPDGAMFGTTRYGGTFGSGTLFRITTNGIFTLLHSFGSDNTGGGPMSPLIFSGDGIFYGNAIGGVIFKMTPSGPVSVLGYLNNTNALSHLGTLCESRDGLLYGVSHASGAFSHGGVWRMTKDGAQTTVYSFVTPGDFPWGGVIEGTDGNLYGTRSGDQNHPYGLVYSVSPAGDYQTIAAFNLTNGAGPEAGLIQGRDGHFYGTTLGGGAYPDTNGFARGTVFRLTVPSAVTPRLRPPIKAGPNVDLTWSAIAGRTYAVQYRTNLTQDDWRNLGISVTAADRLAGASDQNAWDPQRFYRVILSP
jgi:uncharacterized repeat protein (TIGR03803 family)